MNLTFADLGTGALRAALPLAIWGIGAAAYAAAKRDGRALASARWSALITLLLVVLAALAMVGALVTHDFSIAYVARNNALETPLFFTVISLWAALEGSILLWTAILAGATAYVAWRGTPALPRLATTALAVLFAMLAFFLMLVTTPAADPFVRSEIVPLNGNGPNPLLQNHPLMALHPPLLYLGYVLFSVPFAYAIASLILGEGGDRWLVATRRFALVSWGLLGVGIVAGSWWSYAVLGWGGYWAWDPVENAAIMPWLVATAYLHSVMVEEKRRLLRSWNLSLVIATFALTILGTFLTRSGVVNSVHAFTQSAIGPLLLGYLVAIVVLSVGLLLWRMPTLRDSGAVGAPLSREAIFLFQNVVFVAATLTVLLGTLYPLIAEAISGDQLSIGRPYFDRVEVPLALALLFLMGIGPQLPWHGASRATLERQFTAPIVAAAGGALLAVATGLGRIRRADVRARGIRGGDGRAGVRARHPCAADAARRGRGHRIRKSAATERPPLRWIRRASRHRPRCGRSGDEPIEDRRGGTHGARRRALRCRGVHRRVRRAAERQRAAARPARGGRRHHGQWRRRAAATVAGVLPQRDAGRGIAWHLRGTPRRRVHDPCRVRHEREFVGDDPRPRHPTRLVALARRRGRWTRRGDRRAATAKAP